MSITRYIPLQDAFIVSGTVGQTLNTGLDEILEIGACEKYGVEGSARTLLSFDNITLPDSSSAFLHLYLANAENLPVPEYSIKVCPVSESWQEGIGKFHDNPSSTEGVCWKYRDYPQQVTWSVAGGDFTSGRPYVSQSFSTLSSKDINIDVTNLLTSESCDNGFILGFDDEALAISDKSNLKFYSRNTHTIYRPYLEIVTDDAEYDSSLEVASSERINILPENLRTEYSTEDAVRINLRVSSKFPERVYSTTSLFINNLILPEESYWGIRNEHTREMVVDFNEGTKISADEDGSYFLFNANLLEPERYYRMLFQVNIDGSRKIIFDNRNIFKVVKNG